MKSITETQYLVQVSKTYNERYPLYDDGYEESKFVTLWKFKSWKDAEDFIVKEQRLYKGIQLPVYVDSIDYRIVEETKVITYEIKEIGAVKCRYREIL